MAGFQPTTILAATAGILGSAWNSGGQATLSAFAIPGLLSTSSAVPAQLLAQQWAGIYNRGKVLGPQVAALSLLGYGYLIYERNRQNRGWAKYVGAAALSVGIVPYTLLFMDATNQALLGAAAGASISSEAVKELLLRWRGLNLVRSLFPLAAALLGLYELVGPL